MASLILRGKDASVATFFMISSKGEASLFSDEDMVEKTRDHRPETEDGIQLCCSNSCAAFNISLILPFPTAFNNIFFCSAIISDKFLSSPSSLVSSVVILDAVGVSFASNDDDDNANEDKGKDDGDDNNNAPVLLLLLLLLLNIRNDNVDVVGIVVIDPMALKAATTLINNKQITNKFKTANDEEKLEEAVNLLLEKFFFFLKDS